MPAEDDDEVQVISVEIDELRKGREEEEKKLTGEDFMFLLGLSLFILFLVLAHPATPQLLHQNLVFWMSVTMLFLSMAPDYVNRETAKEWLEEYRRTRLEWFYRRIYGVARNGDRYFSSDRFFLLGILLTLLAIVALFYTGEVQELIFGVSYGFFMRAILV